MNTYCGRSLTNNVMRLEDELKVTRVGRRNSSENVLDRKTADRHRHEDDPVHAKGLLAKEEAMRLTTHVNTQTTRLLVAKHTPRWTENVCQSLLDLHQDHISGSPSKGFPNSNAVRQRLETNLHQAAFLETYIDSLHSRLSLQLGVLYSFIAQTDNHYSARLAELSGRDSTSMKILAFITTLFLPGTFIATMFSMDMFTWKHDLAPGGSAVSTQFWIYWYILLRS
jgi:glutamate-1-semialdehyde 2,1-aminomutase